MVGPKGAKGSLGVKGDTRPVGNECFAEPLDVVIILDGSGSINETNWVLAKQFSANLVASLDQPSSPIGQGASETRYRSLN